MFDSLCWRRRLGDVLQYGCHICTGPLAAFKLSEELGRAQAEALDRLHEHTHRWPEVVIIFQLGDRALFQLASRRDLGLRARSAHANKRAADDRPLHSHGL